MDFVTHIKIKCLQFFFVINFSIGLYNIIQYLILDVVAIFGNGGSSKRTKFKTSFHDVIFYQLRRAANKRRFYFNIMSRYFSSLYVKCTSGDKGTIFIARLFGNGNRIWRVFKKV